MKVIKKAFSVLELFLDHGEELTLDEISHLSGLNKPTARRISLALVECGYLVQPAKRSKYSLGMKFLDFSGNIKMNSNIVRVASPHLMNLKQKVSESVTMAIWNGTRTALCQSFLANHPLRVVPDEGSKLVLHATAVGKALLAEVPEDELETFTGSDLTRYTPNTITDLNDLKRHLIIAKHEGVAFDDEEYYQGIRSIASAFRSGEGCVAGSVGILGPSVRISRQKLGEYIEVVRNCAMVISRELGYTG